jgi:hypothetical protein
MDGYLLDFLPNIRDQFLQKRDLRTHFIENRARTDVHTYWACLIVRRSGAHNDNADILPRQRERAPVRSLRSPL